MVNIEERLTKELDKTLKQVQNVNKLYYSLNIISIV